jgi:hypothetical protein
MLEKKEKVLLKKAAAEVEKAKEFTRAKNKRGMVDSACIFLLEKYNFLIVRVRNSFKSLESCGCIFFLA